MMITFTGTGDTSVSCPDDRMRGGECGLVSMIVTQAVPALLRILLMILALIQCTKENRKCRGKGVLARKQL